jgi:hypothetical protein
MNEGRPLRAAAWAAVLLGLTLTACGGGDGSDSDEADGAGGSDGGSEAVRPLDDTLRLNDLQVLGSHNSYHQEQPPEVMALLRAFDPGLADSLEYSHPPLEEQFDDLGIRQIELDVFADSQGGLYSTPAAPGLANVPFEPDPALAAPGFKVLHVQDVDYGTTCPTLIACLEDVRGWSDANPGHIPIMVLIEVKQDAIPDPVNAGFVVPETVEADDLDALDAEIRSVFDPEQLIVPDDVRGERDSLEEAVLEDGWPTLGESRGRVLFALDNGGDLRDLYVAGHPALEGRVLFTSSDRGTPEAAFLKLNDPVADADAIRDAVAAGYVVRTRADADTAQARTGDMTMRDAALASGAQWVSTDYPVDDARFPATYVAAIPGGTPARCNPIRQPDDCTPEAIEDPSLLDTPGG